MSPAGLGAAHLDPTIWARVNRLLIRKALGEFAHELLLQPKPDGAPDAYVLETDDGAVRYHFRARRLPLDHWSIEADSIVKMRGSDPCALDALAFLIEVSGSLGLSEAVMPIYLDEISNTLYGAAYKQAHGERSAAALVVADYQTIEAAMSEGHPIFVANNGRVGFDADDHSRYAPETGRSVRLVWTAVSRDRATFRSLSDLDEAGLMAMELGAQRDAFEAELRHMGLDPSAYLLMPIHPWQWTNRIAMSFVADIADRHIVYLGTSADDYQPQQSIRTFFNQTRPSACYIKTSISVLNMGFMRGLSPNYMLATPAINEWLGRLVAADATLAAMRFSIIREIASIGYRQPYYETALKTDTPYRKMLSALWRESPVAGLAPGERLMTMAALLHVDPQGIALVGRLIEASGLSAQIWITRYLDAYLAPLVHCFYAYDLAFMPHGENLIMVLEGSVPTRMIMKDIGEEIGILNGGIELPAEIARIAFTVDEAQKLNGLFTDVFDNFFRPLTAVLDEHGSLDAVAFWRLVAACIHGYQDAHPEFAARFARHDLFAPRFTRNCLNRLQIADNQQMLDLSDPEKSLQFVGQLDNPLAPYARTRLAESAA
jgi:siderophore synthetase component